ncbi:hypothetical protein CCHR01_16291 [Colletotrichum chrysophilum]|uniref:Uncharacterized protein n=1 Tax=Colletotrichum chrysophilum TaxID=1836956 RepID=A0AAD9A4F1_9PEZI|nr:hypothetical protein CCHR01_16291 [Colletotrichum chrysophilum]
MIMLLLGDCRSWPVQSSQRQLHVDFFTYGIFSSDTKNSATTSTDSCKCGLDGVPMGLSSSPATLCTAFNFWIRSFLNSPTPNESGMLVHLPENARMTALSRFNAESCVLRTGPQEREPLKRAPDRRTSIDQWLHSAQSESFLELAG